MKSWIIILFVAISAVAQSQSFESHIQNGDAFYNQKNYAAAIESFTAAIQLNSNSVLALNKRANTYLAMNEPDNAGPDLDAVLQLDPQNAYAFGNRGVAFRQKKMYKEAIIDFTEAIKYREQNAWAYHMRGLSYLDLLNYQMAIEDFSEVMNIDPKHYVAHLNRGICYMHLQYYELAINDFTKAIDLNSKPNEAYSWRGYTMAKMSRFEQAVEDYSMAIQIAPGISGNYNNRGLYYNQLGQYAASAADFEKCISMNPTSGNHYINIISPLVRLGKLQEANGYYQQYVQKGLKSFLNTSNYEFLRYYINALELTIKEQYEGALAAIDRANVLYGNELKEETKRLYVDMMFLEGLLLEKLNMPEDAWNVYDQSLVINPYQPDVEERLNLLTKSASAVAAADKAAPDISIITPASSNVELVRENASIQIVGKAKDPSGIEYVKINGVPVEKLEEDGLFIANITLASGENNVVFTAADKQGNVATKSMAINATAQATATATRGTTVVSSGQAGMVIETTPVFHAILVASQNYVDPKFNDLQNPRNDALALGEILQKKYGFESKNIDTIFDRSREEIMGAIVRKSSSLTANESLIIFYAGHGVAVKYKNSNEVDGYWVPSSATYDLHASYISADDINKAIKRSEAKHILVIADACFSGAMTRGLPPDAAKEMSRQYVIPSRKVMASGNLELVPDESRFIKYLKQRLMENNEKYLTGQDLFSSLRTAVMNNTETVPQYAAIKNVGDEGGEFIFIRKN